MKKFFLFVVSCIIFCVPFSANAAPLETTKNGEQIDNYIVKIQIDQRGDLKVEEDIYYNFGKNQKHGIYRKIPLKEFHDVKKISIYGISVKDEKGNDYTKSVSTQNNVLEMKIGDADTLVTGSKVYKIFYTVTGAQIRGEKDILSWNAIGQNWEVPIQNGFITVQYPKSFSPKLISSLCYFGYTESTKECVQKEKQNTWVRYVVSKLPAYSGATVTLEFQNNTFLPPTLLQKIRQYLPLLLPLGVFLALFFWWSRHGKDPHGKGTIITQFDIPGNLCPIEVGALVDEKIQGKDVSAQIIYLAMQGHLKIVEEEKSGIFGKKDFSLVQVSPLETVFENEFDRILFQSLFALAKPDANGNLKLKLGDLKTKFARQFRQIQESVYTSLIAKGYFPHNPMKIRRWFSLFGTLLILYSIRTFAENFSYIENFYWPLGFILSGVIILVFAPLMSQKTSKGVEAYEHIQGLKAYLSVAEKDRINFHNAPEKNPQIFETFLPVAVTLGVEKAWAKYFEGMYMDPPRWYNSSVTGQGFHSIYFVSSLSSFSNATGTSLNSSARSGGRGGFSGGGRGGGGGGSW
jgi:uncharacterized membrane protein